jgi:hypothetical protein
MEKRDYCFDYILSSCKNDKCIYSHVIVTDKDAFIKKHEYRIKYRNTQHTAEPSFTEIKPKNNQSTKILSKCIICSKGFLFDQTAIKPGDTESMKCKTCISNI